MNPARLISIATQLALSSNDTPERQEDPGEAPFPELGAETPSSFQFDLAG